MEQAFESFLVMLDNAVSRIAKEYFLLPVAGADPAYRERVYCYELYHQLRCQWNGFSFSLGGEIDKSGHLHFRNGRCARAKPDMLVHTPGRMDRNLAVVEIKPANVGLDGMGKDLRKLNWFCDKARYFRGIFLVYGQAGDANVLTARLRQAAPSNIDFHRVLCRYHQHVGGRMEPIRP